MPVSSTVSTVSSVAPALGTRSPQGTEMVSFQLGGRKPGRRRRCHPDRAPAASHLASDIVHELRLPARCWWAHASARQEVTGEGNRTIFWPDTCAHDSPASVERARCLSSVLVLRLQIEVQLQRKCKAWPRPETLRNSSSANVPTPI